MKKLLLSLSLLCAVSCISATDTRKKQTGVALTAQEVLAWTQIAAILHKLFRNNCVIQRATTEKVLEIGAVNHGYYTDATTGEEISASHMTGNDCLCLWKQYQHAVSHIPE